MTEQSGSTTAWRPDALRITLFLLTVVTISRVHKYFPALAPLRPALVLAALSLGWILIKPRLTNLSEALRHWPARVVLALLILACVGAPFGVSLGNSAKFIQTDYIKVIIFAFMIIVAIRNTEELRWFVWAYIVSALILDWMAVFTFNLSRSGGYAARLSGLFTYDANDLGCVLVTGLPLVLLGFSSARTTWSKWLAGVTVAGIGAALARSGSRGAFVGLVIVGLTLLFLMKHVAAWKRLTALGVVLVGFLVAVPPGYWKQMGTLTDPTQDYNWTSAYGRRAIAERGLEMMIRFPVFGVGINNFPRADATISSRAEYFVGGPGQALQWRAPHNSYVQIGSELGFPGLILWCSLIFGGILGMLRLRKKIPKHWRKGDREQTFLYMATLYLPGAFIGFGVTSFFVSFAFLDPIYLLAAYATGVYASVERRLSLEAPARMPRRGRKVSVGHRRAVLHAPPGP